LRLTNTGTQTAIGCHAQARPGALMKVTWRPFNPAGVTPFGNVNQPVDIAPGQTRMLSIALTRQRNEEANLVAPGSVAIDCANTAALVSNLQNRFDTTNDRHRPADVVVSLLSPAGPVQPGATVRFSAVNRNAARPVEVSIRYEQSPPEPNFGKHFKAHVCRTATATANCMAPPVSVFSIVAAQNRTYYFLARVEEPVSSPSPATERRLFLNVVQDDPQASVSWLSVGAESIAVQPD
jgi:hypothetical protein